MPNISNQDYTTLVNYITNTQYFAAYPKRLRVNTNKNNTALLKDLLIKYWKPLIEKAEIGGTGKERFVRTYHTSKEIRDQFMSDIQAIKSNGYLNESDREGYWEDQNGNYVKDDGTIHQKEITLTDAAQQLFSGISNTTIIIGALLIVGVILLLRRKPQIPVQYA